MGVSGRGGVCCLIIVCFSEEERSALIEEIPAGRMGSPEEVASLAYSLATASSYLNGQILTLDGGWI